MLGFLKRMFARIRGPQAGVPTLPLVGLMIPPAPLPPNPSFIRMAVGGDADPHSAIIPQAHILASTARYQIDFQSYLLAMLGLQKFVEAAKLGQAKPYASNHLVALRCKQSPHRWYWWPHHTAAVLALNISPTDLVLERAHCPQPVASEILNLGSADQLMQTFGQALATSFFERHRNAIDGKFGNIATWPPVWNFARVVRNAMSHGGVINIQNPNAAPVHWNGLTYAPDDNGRRILHTDLWPGDLMDLLIEMDGHVP